MGQLKLAYDYLAFAKDHESEFYAYSDSYEMLKDIENVILWTYPGSGEIAKIFDGKIGENKTANDQWHFQNNLAYRDGEGREWIFGGRWSYEEDRTGENIWICVSDPQNRDIAAKPQNPEDTAAEDIADTPSTGLSPPWVVIVLVFMLLVSTALLIRLFWRPNRSI